MTISSNPDTFLLLGSRENLLRRLVFIVEPISESLQLGVEFFVERDKVLFRKIIEHIRVGFRIEKDNFVRLVDRCRINLIRIKQLEDMPSASGELYFILVLPFCGNFRREGDFFNLVHEYLAGKDAEFFALVV